MPDLIHELRGDFAWCLERCLQTDGGCGVCLAAWETMRAAAPSGKLMTDAH